MGRQGDFMPRARRFVPGPAPVAHRLIQRCGTITPATCPCHGERDVVRRSALAPRHTHVPAIVHEVLSLSGEPLSASARVALEPRFGRDFSNVRVHTGTRAARAAEAVSARAFTVGRNLVFGSGQYAPHTNTGLSLLAHELTHVLQQQASTARPPDDLRLDDQADASEREARQAAASARVGLARSSEIAVAAEPDGPTVLQRACLPAAACAGPVAGSAEEFDVREEAAEASARARRTAMPRARALASGHEGHARQLELFFESAMPGLLANVHGIFIDMDMSPGTGAMSEKCSLAVPPITGATKPCVFVPGNLNQEAYAFRSTAAPTIGGKAREDWRIATLQTVRHEIQHALFGASKEGTAPPPGVSAACPRSLVDGELTEMNAVMSEFPLAFRAILTGAPAGHHARARLRDWFTEAIRNPSESIGGALKKLRCECDCPDVDRYVIDTFNFVASGWTSAERAAFNTELRKPGWGLSWPIAP